MRHIIYIVMIAAAAATVSSCSRGKRAAGREDRQEQTAVQPSLGEPSSEKSSVNRSRKISVGKLNVEKIEGFSRTGLLSGELKVRVCNDSRYAVTVVRGVATLYYVGSMVGSVSLCEPVVIPKHATTSMRVPLEAHIGNPLAVYGVWNKVRRGELSEMTVSVEATVAAGVAERNIVKNDIPLEKLLAAAGMTVADIRNMLK